MTWAVAAAALSAVSAYGSIQQGRAQRVFYETQAAQTRVETERKAIQYQVQANQILQRVNSANSAVIARGYAGGTKGFEGSAALVQEINNTRGGREFTIALDNADSVRRAGLIQATLYESAGKTAERASYFDAAGKLGMAAFSYGQLGGATSTTTTQATGSTGFGINPNATWGLR